MPIYTKDVAAYVGFAKPTVRNWAVEFARHLSEGAKPGTGKKRQYTVEDMTVFTLIADLKRRNATYEEIHASLDAGQRGDAPEMSEGDIKAISASAGEQRASIEVQSLQRMIVDLRQQLAVAEDKAARFASAQIRIATLEANVENAQANEQAARQEIERIREELKEAQQEVRSLNRQLGREYAEGYKTGFGEGRGVAENSHNSGND